MSVRAFQVDEAFSGGVWDGASSGARAGVLRGSIPAVLGAVEPLLGCRAAPLALGQRLAVALEALADRPAAFWAASLAADPLATTRELVHWYDWLSLHGWSGEGGPRLAELHQALSGLPPGVPARLRQATAGLRARQDVSAKVELFAPLTELPLLHRELLTALDSSPTVRSFPRAPGAAPTFDVLLPEGRLPAGKLDPRALQLIRPSGPLAAADAVAAALAASPDVPTLIVGGSPVLDAALHRHGLPTCGASGEPTDNALLAVLPLVMELAVFPANPQAVLELLTLPRQPAAGVAHRLVRALETWPGLGNPEWTQALDEGLATVPDEARGALAARLQGLFSHDVKLGEPVPVAALRRRARLVLDWLQGHRRAGSPLLPAVAGAIAHAAAFNELLEGAPDTLSLVQLRRLVEEAREAVPPGSTFPAEAGLPSVRHPGAVVGPVERLVWWDFTRDAAPRPRVPALSPDELESLRAAGVVLPSAAELARRRAARVERAFRQVSRALWLVCPHAGVDGEPAAPHPGWDLAASRLSREQLHALSAPEPRVPVKRFRPPGLAAPGPVLEWSSSGPVARRKLESPSSLERVLGCSLAWTLEHAGRLRDGLPALPEGSPLLGSLFHRLLLERFLALPHAERSDAAAVAEALFNEEGPRHAAQLFLPGATDRLARAREILRGAAGELQALSARWRVRHTEHTLEGRAFSRAVQGRMDLIVERGAQVAVLDLKTSGEGRFRESLEGGTALQLHIYAELLRQHFPEATVHSGYLVLDTQALLSTSRELAGSHRVVVPQVDPDAAFRQFRAALAERWRELEAGRLSAPGVQDDHDIPTSEVGEEGVTVKPGCSFCAFDGLCGRRYGRLPRQQEVDDAD